jgi:hypothetical protein
MPTSHSSDQASTPTSNEGTPDYNNFCEYSSGYARYIEANKKQEAAGFMMSTQGNMLLGIRVMNFVTK